MLVVMLRAVKIIMVIRQLAVMIFVDLEAASGMDHNVPLLFLAQIMIMIIME